MTTEEMNVTPTEEVNAYMKGFAAHNEGEGEGDAQDSSEEAEAREAAQAEIRFRTAMAAATTHEEKMALIKGEVFGEDAPFTLLNLAGVSKKGAIDQILEGLKQTEVIKALNLPESVKCVVEIAPEQDKNFMTVYFCLPDPETEEGACNCAPECADGMDDCECSCHNLPPTPHTDNKEE